MLERGWRRTCIRVVGRGVVVEKGRWRAGRGRRLWVQSAVGGLAREGRRRRRRERGRGDILERTEAERGGNIGKALNTIE